MAFVIYKHEERSLRKSTIVFLTFVSLCLAFGIYCISFQNREIEKLKLKVEHLEKLLLDHKPCDTTTDNDSEIQPN